MQNDEIEIDLKEIFMFLLHWAWLIAVCGLVTGIISFSISKFIITPQYESTTKVYILNKQNESTLTYSDVQLGTQLTKDYAQLIKSRHVLEQVAENCSIAKSYEQFSKRVKVETITDTRIIAITVRDEDPVMAQFLANEIRIAASAHIKNVMDIEAVNVAEVANLPQSPASPNVLKWTLIGLFLGIFLCAAVLVIRFITDDTIKTSDDVEKYLKLSTLAMIPIIGEEEKGRGRKRGSRDSNFVGVSAEKDDYRDEDEEADAESGTTDELVVTDLDKSNDLKEVK